MEEIQLETLLVANEKNTKEILDSLDLVMQQNEKNNSKPEIESLVVATLKIRKSIDKGNKKINQAIEKIKIPEQKETNLEQTNKLLEDLITESKKDKEIIVELNLI